MLPVNGVKCVTEQCYKLHHWGKLSQQANRTKDESPNYDLYKQLTANTSKNHVIL